MLNDCGRSRKGEETEDLESHRNNIGGDRNTCVAAVIKI